MKSGVLTITMADAANEATVMTFALVKQQRIKPSPELGLPTVADAIDGVVAACDRVERAQTVRAEQDALRKLMLAARRLRLASSASKAISQNKG